MTGKQSGKPLEILLIEDSPSDAALAAEALREVPAHHNLHHVEDGIAALAFLRREGAHAQAPRPNLILLDLNLPRKDGLEVLAEIKADKDLAAIPVIVLTTSQNEHDILRVYALHANCYVTKPVDFTQFAKLIKTIHDFWFTVAQLPLS